LAEENLDWIFVNTVPMLCEKTRIAKQQKVETWLNLHQVARKLGLQKPKKREPTTPVRYIV
jgi:hypothetical protein